MLSSQSRSAATLQHATPTKPGLTPAESSPRNDLIFEDSDNELEHLRFVAEPIQKQRKIEELRSLNAGKTTHAHGKLLDALAKPLPPKRVVAEFATLPIQRAIVYTSSYSGRRQKELNEFVQLAEGVFALDADIYRTLSVRTRFAQLFITGEAATAWRTYCKRHPPAKHTWEAIKAPMQDHVALPQQRFACAFCLLRNAKQGQDQSVTSFVAYITGLAHEPDVFDLTKRMFLLTGLRSEVRGMMPRGITCEAHDAMFDATIWAKNDLKFEAGCMRTGSKKDKEADKDAAKHEQKQQYHPTTGCDAGGADCLLSGQGGFRGFRSRELGCGCGDSTPQGNHAGSSSGAAPHSCKEMLRGRSSSACHHCGPTVYVIAGCPDKQQEGSAATPQQSGKA